MSGQRTPWSRGAVVLLCAIILVLRALTLTNNELSWDVFGYYLYLPATFIHSDPFLHDTGWIKQVMEQHEISGTLYQLSTAPDGGPIYFFLMGMSIMYLPFFLCGHAIAVATGQPLDGFSLPYQYSIAIGCLLYTFIGLAFLRKILLKYFSDRLVAGVLVIVVLGTNYLHFMTVKSLETANFLFCWMAVLVWCTLRWHEDHRRKHVLGIATAVAFMALIKPSEVICALIPILWGVGGRDDWKAKRALFRTHARDLWMAVLLGLLIALPQMLYWTITTGSPLYDSYKNPGVGLDLWSPHVGNVLFSFRKGWVIYTPVMVLAIVGFFLLKRRIPALFTPILVYSLIAFWIISSWTEWWYGASYSIRPMITSYVLLAIPLGCTMERIAAARMPIRTALSVLTIALIGFNLFQDWQFDHWILHNSRTTPAYYFAVLGKTHVPPGADALLSIERSFDGVNQLSDTTAYSRTVLADLSFQTDTSWRVSEITGTGRRGYQLDSTNAYLPVIERAYRTFTNQDHFWLRAHVSLVRPAGDTSPPPCLVMTMERKGGSYGYQGTCAPDTAYGQLELSAEYLTPEIRSGEDRAKVYLWHRGKSPIWVERVTLVAFTPR